jgi:hypothetical protein
LLVLIVDELVQAQLGIGALHQAQMLLADGELALNAAGRLTTSRIALASGDAERAATMAGTLTEESTAQRMGFVAIEALLVRAQAVLALGRPDEATLLLADALRLALPEQLVQPFRDAGPAVRTLLEALERNHPKGVLRAFIWRVLAT